MALSKRLRFEILRRDNHTCRYCGAAAPYVKLHVDHVLAATLGGTDDASNLVAACADCNHGKSSTNANPSVVAQVTDDAIRWARAVETAAHGALFERYERDEYVNYILYEWSNGDDQADVADARKADYPDDAPRSLDAFRQRGLPIEILEDALHAALRNRSVNRYDKWRYFMGIAWRHVSDMEAQAKRIYDLPARV